LLGRLADLNRTEPKDRDARIFPGIYAPVMVWEDGKRSQADAISVPPAGKPAFYDAKFPGTYNARRDNLQGFWKAQFGHAHGVILVNAFYENVARHKVEGRELAPGEAEENVVSSSSQGPPKTCLSRASGRSGPAPGA